MYHIIVNLYSLLNKITQEALSIKKEKKIYIYIVYVVMIFVLLKIPKS